nr:hypothetical protein BaRGS_010595 [Batillaria attramentaria]
MADASTNQADGSAGKAEPIRVHPSTLKFIQWQGMMIPNVGTDPEVQFQKVKDMKLRDSDVILCSYPKCGTHWMYRILDMLVHKTAEYSAREAEQNALDMQNIDFIDTLPPPRVLLSHLPFPYLPDQVKDGRAKLVHIYRNPKAVMVSMFHQMKNAGIVPDLTLDKMEGMIQSGKAPYRNYYYFLDQVAEFEKNNPGVPIFHISYEELKLNTVETLGKLAAYLGVDASSQLLQDIAAAVSFKKQKEEEAKLGDPSKKNLRFFRKGEIDDWKNYLTVAQSERLDQLIKDRADRCRFTAKYLTSD